MPTWNDFVAHPNYDDFWKKQSLEPRLTQVDRADAATSPAGSTRKTSTGRSRSTSCSRSTTRTNQNFLVVGPWNHGGWAGGPGDKLGQHHVRPRHRASTSARRCRRRSSPTTSRTRATPTAGSPDVPDRREQVGELRRAGRRRPRRRGSSTSTRTASSRSIRRPMQTKPASTSTSPTPRSRCRTARGRSRRRIPARSGRCGWWRTSGSRTAGPTC